MEDAVHQNLSDPWQPHGLGVLWHASGAPKVSSANSLPVDSLRHCRALAYLRQVTKIQSLETWTDVADDSFDMSLMLQF